MALLRVCVLTLCTDLFNNFEYDIYSHEIKLAKLTLESNMTLHNVTYLKDALELRVGLRVEQTIHDILVAKIHIALDKLTTLADKAKRDHLDTKACLDVQQAQVRRVFQDQVGEITACIGDMEPTYNYILAEVEELQKNVQALVNDITTTTNKCKEEPIGRLGLCLTFEHGQLEKKLELLQYTYIKLNRQCQDILTHIPPLIECIQATEREIILKLYEVLADAKICYTTMEKRWPEPSLLETKM